MKYNEALDIAKRRFLLLSKIKRLLSLSSISNSSSNK
jgi:hypothetical protein